MEKSKNDYVTLWQVYADNLLTFPGKGKYRIDWGDGTTETATNSVVHTYPDAGEYTVRASRSIERFSYHAGNQTDQLLEVKQWGAAKWVTMHCAFAHAIQLKFTATDVPDLSEVRSTAFMLHGAKNFNSDISGWDMSNVTVTQFMLNNAHAFNSDISGWDMGNVVNYFHMLHGAWSFKQDVSGWDKCEHRLYGRE